MFHFFISNSTKYLNICKKLRIKLNVWETSFNNNTYNNNNNNNNNNDNNNESNNNNNNQLRAVHLKH